MELALGIAALGRAVLCTIATVILARTRGVKLLMRAQASISVPSTEK